MYRKLLNQPQPVQQAGVQYPPAASGPGIEVKSLEEILAPQMELIKLIDMTTETANVFESRYWPAIERYAQTVHLLPASDCDHHEGQAGLLHHGLEVGLYAMQHGRHGLYGMKMGIQKRDGRERRLFACFMAGLCHDLGRVVTDVQVTSGTGGLVWSPFVERLANWAAHNRVSKYYVDCQPNRYKLHVNVTPKILNKVMTDQDCKYIAEIDKGLFNEMMLAFGPLAGPSNVVARSIGSSDIRAMVQKADCRSVEEDKKKSRTPADLGMERPAPMAHHFTDGMRRSTTRGYGPGWPSGIAGSRRIGVWGIGGRSSVTPWESRRNLHPPLRKQGVYTAPVKKREQYGNGA